jgi:hypothetical protein
MSSIYTGHRLDTPAKLDCVNKKLTPSLSQLEQQYDRLRKQLAHLGPISQGSVQDRTARKGGGAGYQWTRKVAQKTVTVSLSAEQFAQMNEAVKNYRHLRRQLKTMEMLSRRIIFQATPHPDRHKRLSQKVLGTN